VHQLQPEVQKLRTQIDKQSTEIISLQTKLKRAETSLHAINPAENTYNINANQSLSLDNGKLTVGLIGPPRNNVVVININGQQHHAVTGDIFNVTLDPATACNIKVQSFDMFQVYVNARCTKAK
jgi:hypothetical protein